MAYRRFTEKEIRKIGGLSPDDRALHGIDELTELALVAVPKFREALARGRGVKDWYRNALKATRSLREANSEAALGFLVRKGIQVEANDWYIRTKKAWPEYSRVTGSNNLAEWHAPLYMSQFADIVEAGVPFPEGKIAGEDTAIRNRKFGRIEAIERELFDDDQSGQIRQRSQTLGASMAGTESIWASSKFVGAARTYANISVPVSTYTTTNAAGTSITQPFDTALYDTSVGNVASSAGQNLNMGYLKQGYAGLMNAIDPFSNKILVEVNCLLVSSNDAVNGKLLLAEGAYPAVLGQSNTTAATAPVLGGTVSAAGAQQGVLAGFPGGWGSPNPMAGIGMKLVVERYLPNWFWAMGEYGKGFIFQERDPLEIVQESTTAGASFNADAYRFRSRRRFEAEWVNGASRFWYAGTTSATTPPTGTF